MEPFNIEFKIKKIIDEFGDVKTPANFSGGCMKSSMNGICAHLRPNGKLAKVEINCPHWDKCKEGNYSINI